MTFPKPLKRETVRRPIPRRSAPKRASKKLMPKCKHCAHPYRSHGQDKTVPPPPISNGCWRCFACHGYEPARGIRQKRRTPAAALKLTADGLWSKVVHARPDGCEIQHYREHECKGGYQAMHGIPRTYNATRHLPINGFKGCAAIHKYYTEHPEEWSWVTLKAWGGPAYLELWETARAMQPVDLEATVAKLKAELAERTQERSA